MLMKLKNKMFEIGYQYFPKVSKEKMEPVIDIIINKYPGLTEELLINKIVPECIGLLNTSFFKRMIIKEKRKLKDKISWV
jgi:hypothetical protein